MRQRSANSEYKGMEMQVAPVLDMVERHLRKAHALGGVPRLTSCNLDVHLLCDWECGRGGGMYVSLRKDAGGFFAYLEILFCCFCKALGICNFRHSNGVISSTS